MLTVAVDFDGTIVTHEYPKIGKEIPFAIDTLKRLQKDFQNNYSCRLTMKIMMELLVAHFNNSRKGAQAKEGNHSYYQKTQPHQ